MNGEIRNHHDTAEAWDTEARQLQESNTLSEAKFQHIYDNSPVMMHSINAAGDICNVNKKWLETTGYQREEVIGRKADFLMTKESSERAFNEVIPRFWRDGFVRDIHYQYVKKSGEVFDVLLNCTATIDPEGQKISLSVTRDITEKLQIERTLKEYQQSLEDKVTARTNDLKKAQEAMVHQARLASVGTMLSGFAHEIRNPLNFTSGGTRQLKRQVAVLQEHLQATQSDSPDIRSQMESIANSLRLIEEGNDRIVGIVDNLKTFSETREHPAEEPCDLAASIQATLILLRGILNSHQIHVEWNPDTYPAVRGNRIELKQILFNLLHNACQAMPNGGILSIHVNQNADQEIECRICDSGSGIDSIHRDRIFDPFYTTREPGEGTGLGLSIALSIAQRHGGDISLVPSEGGTTFLLKLEPSNI